MLCSVRGPCDGPVRGGEVAGRQRGGGGRHQGAHRELWLPLRLAGIYQHLGIKYHSVEPFFMPSMSTFLVPYIWHNQRGRGRSWIYFIISPWCAQIGPCKEVSLLFQVTIVGGSPKALFTPVDPTWWPGRSIPCWGYSKNIEFWGSFAGSFTHNQHLKHNLIFREPVVFSFRNTPWFVPKHVWFLSKFGFRENFF